MPATGISIYSMGKSECKSRWNRSRLHFVASHSVVKVGKVNFSLLITIQIHNRLRTSSVNRLFICTHIRTSLIYTTNYTKTQACNGNKIDPQPNAELAGTWNKWSRKEKGRMSQVDDDDNAAAVAGLPFQNSYINRKVHHCRINFFRLNLFSVRPCFSDSVY